MCKQLSTSTVAGKKVFIAGVADDQVRPTRAFLCDMHLGLELTFFDVVNRASGGLSPRLWLRLVRRSPWVCG